MNSTGIEEKLPWYLEKILEKEGRDFIPKSRENKATKDKKIKEIVNCVDTLPLREGTHVNRTLKALLELYLSSSKDVRKEGFTSKKIIEKLKKGKIKEGQYSQDLRQVDGSLKTLKEDGYIGRLSHTGSRSMRNIIDKNLFKIKLETLWEKKRGEISEEYKKLKMLYTILDVEEDFFSEVERSIQHYKGEKLFEIYVRRLVGDADKSIKIMAKEFSSHNQFKVLFDRAHAQGKEIEIILHENILEREEGKKKIKELSNLGAKIYLCGDQGFINLGERRFMLVDDERGLTVDSKSFKEEERFGVIFEDACKTIFPTIFESAKSMGEKVDL